VVELGALHLKCSRRLGIECVGELDSYMPAVVRKGEVGTTLNDPDAGDVLHYAELIEDRQVAGQQRFSNMEARMDVLLDEDYVPTFAFEYRRCCRARRPAADYQYVAAVSSSHAG